MTSTSTCISPIYTVVSRFNALYKLPSGSRGGEEGAVRASVAAALSL